MFSRLDDRQWDLEPPAAGAKVPASGKRCGRIAATLRLVLAAALALGCVVPQATSAAERRPVKSLLEMRRENVVVQGYDLSCGAAALATLLNYQHGDAVSEREVAAALIQREEYLARPEIVRLQQGFSFFDLKRYVEQRGYRGIGYGRLALADLIELAPIMVPVNFNGYNHFVVFRGVLADRVLLADPAFGNRTVRVGRFQNAWLDYPELGKVGFTVARSDGTAPPGRLAPWPDDVPTAPGAVLRRVLG